MTTNIPIFDGHNDVLLRLYKSASSDVVSDFLVGEERGHVDLKKARAGSLVGGFFAMYSPSTNFGSAMKQMTGGQYALPLPPPLPVRSSAKPPRAIPARDNTNPAAHRRPERLALPRPFSNVRSP